MRPAATVGKRPNFDRIRTSALVGCADSVDSADLADWFDSDDSVSLVCVADVPGRAVAADVVDRIDLTD